MVPITRPPFTSLLLGLLDLTLLSLSKNPLGGAGLKLLLRAISDLKVSSLNLSRTVSAKGGGGTSFNSVLRDRDVVDFFSKVRSRNFPSCL